ncbi:hypothetical protein CHS0354_012876 [Potamilus streckersoni]|uniref:TIR domain-containing protein n=1 Tax=Potamilus streckersoni TaxID=2493646 RepID=A0AAE0W2P6_9BIVA|nr:hypothetical protein CHS0354_012876 [Potamilus streckersoni]
MAMILLPDINITSSHYIPWDFSDIQRKDLFCPKTCNASSDTSRTSQILEPTNVNSYDHKWCCCCYARTCYELVPPTCDAIITYLHLEYIGADGRSIILNDTKISSNFLKSRSVDGVMTSLPLNLMAYSNIISLEYSRNRILDISNISFLKDLNELILDNNLITHISNKTFCGLTNLRRITVSRNLIKTIDTNTFSHPELNIHYFDASYNKLTSIDATNLFLDNYFCEMNYNNNTIKGIVNQQHFRLDKNNTYATGLVSLASNALKYFPNLTEFGIEDYADIEKLVKIGLNLDVISNLDCDCSLVPYLTRVGSKALIDFFGYWEKLTCKTPQKFENMSIKDLYYNANMDDLVCDITEKCPSKCRCYDQQNREKLVINCTSLGLTELPDYLPEGMWGSKVELLLRNNSVTKLDQRNYIQRIQSLDLSGNNIASIDDTAVRMMNSDIHMLIPNNSLQTLPRSFKSLNPDNLEIGDAFLQCSCDFLWAENWHRYESQNRNNTLQCLYNGNRISVDLMSSALSECEKKDVTIPVPPPVIAIVSLTMLLAFLLILYFRFEVFVIYRRFRKYIRNKHYLDRDAFISVNELNSESFQWVLHDLEPFLRDDGYRTTIPWKDFELGNYRETETIKAIQRHKAYIVIVASSDNEDNDRNSIPALWADYEFNCIWKEFVSDSNKHVIVVNFDQVNSHNVSDRRLRALARVGKVADHCDREHKLPVKVRKLLVVLKFNPICCDGRLWVSFRGEEVADNWDNAHRLETKIRKRVSNLNT